MKLSRLGNPGSAIGTGMRIGIASTTSTRGSTYACNDSTGVATRQVTDVGRDGSNGRKKHGRGVNVELTTGD